MKIKLQHDERDCGAACLAMVAEHYGYVDSVKEFRKLANTAQDGTALDEMVRAAETIGFTAEALSGDIEDLCDEVDSGKIKLPFIAYVITKENYTHYVVVSRLDKNGVVIYDPAEGKIQVSVDDFANAWDNCIMTLTPSGTFKKHRNKSHDFLSFFSLLKGQGRRFVLIILISTLISGIGIAGAFAFQLIIDHSPEMVEVEGEHGHDIEFLTENDALNDVLKWISNYFGHLTAERVSNIFVCLIALYIFAGIIQYIRGRLIIAMSKEIDMGLTLPYFNRIVDLPVSSVLTRKTGDYMSRYSDASAIRNAISAATVTMIIDTMMAVGCGIILYFQNIRLFLIAIAIIALYTAIVLGNSKRIKDSNRVFMEQNAHIQSYLKESIDGIQAIKMVNASEQVKNIMSSKFHRYLAAAIKRSRIEMCQDVAVTVIETVGISVILWQGFTLVIQGTMSLGALITFYALLGYLITPVKNLIELQPVIQSAVVAAERMNDILDMETEDKSGKDMTAVQKTKEWRVNALNFRYGYRDLLLKGVGFSFQKGQKVAVVGKSGSGKTTLAKLFTRFYEPESGEIYADGVSIKEYSVDSLRKTMAYVSNDDSLFSGSLLDNLVLGVEKYSDEELEAVCKITRLDELFDDIYDVLQVRVEESGANLSSGQRQRIAIARALLRKPGLLILDEATANLDPRMEKEIMDAAKEYYPELTILMITHRLSTIMDCDRIIVLHEGQIAGDGIHSELQDTCQAYRDLMADGAVEPT